ncbi:oligoribonuclease NrnB [Campylobacter hyointestinalis subsp. lawsonii CCUG 27631]|uniref:DHH family phosphoesterase n=1 Tax=Campylobacter hyointestinalis TaxID=198 RepID=UPI0007C950FC|nr:hypothetical protein [Campylobacter hyointestinalis]ANE34056.1 oligoribonuclease NrnB [Campylobacter hyointestinalis subsp. lawsonii CCUG 27631]
MKIYHLSHTDLDGYSCQFVSSFYLKNVKFYNSNYGKEIDEKFSQILKDIDEQKAVILITDLNLSLAQCANFENAISGKDIKLMLLDHHQTGLECSNKFKWYYLDSSRSATKITYDFFSSLFGKDDRLSAYCNVVNAVDIWLKDSEDFELGKVCMSIISGAKEINKVLFENEHIQYVFYLINSFMNYIGLNNAHIALDNDTHKIKKNFFKFKNDDTLSNLNSAYLVRLLSDAKEKFTVLYRGHKGILTHNIGSTSVIGNDFLSANDDYDFFLDITSKKTMSFRANGKLDVSKMAAELVGGGGHINASGGLFVGFKDGFAYEPIKAQIVELINKKTGE